MRPTGGEQAVACASSFREATPEALTNRRQICQVNSPASPCRSDGLRHAKGSSPTRRQPIAPNDRLFFLEPRNLLD